MRCTGGNEREIEGTPTNKCLCWRGGSGRCPCCVRTRWTSRRHGRRLCNHRFRACIPLQSCSRAHDGLTIVSAVVFLRVPQVSRLVLDMTEGISHSDFMQLHTLIYKLCTIPGDVGGQAKAGELYFRLEQQLIAECKTMAAELLASGGILDLYVARWANFSKGIQALDGLFDYLNRYWIKAHGIGGEQHIVGVHASVRAMGVAVWRDYVQVAAVAQRVLVELWDMSMHGRAGDEIGMDYGLARQVVGIYLELGTRDDGAPVYQTDFEDAYVAQTMHFYTLEAQELVSDPACDSTGYVSHAHARVSAELRCAARFTTRQTMSLLCAACEEAFISLQREWLQEAFDRIIKDEPPDARAQLWHIYSLLRRVDGGLAKARERFHDLVVRQGSTALAAVALDAMGSHDQGAEDGCAEGGEARGQGNELQGLLALSFLEAFLHRYVHYHAMAHECFENDPEFVQAVDKGLVVVVSTVPRSAELLAVCAHSVLEEGGAAAMALGRESEHALLHIITCLKYILDRETFETHYARLLARRLLNNTSLSLETEEMMAQALRRVTGADFASRLLRMLSDKARSVQLDLATAVASGGHGHTPGPVMQVMLLTAGTWPVGEAQRFELPATLSRALEAFTARYESEYKRRKLTWHLNLSRADVRAWFGGKMYDLSMSLKQLVVMLVFEDGGGRDMDYEHVSEEENAEHVQPVQSARATSALHLAQVTGLMVAEVESVVRSLRRAGLLHLTVPCSPHVPEYSSTTVPPQCPRQQDPEEGDGVQSDAEEEALAIAMSLEGCSGQRGMGEEGAGLTLAGLQVDDDYDDVRDVQAEAGQSSREEAFTLSLKEVLVCTPTQARARVLCSRWSS